MKRERKPAGRISLSPDQEALVRDWLADLPARADHPPGRVFLLGSFSEGEREECFARLLAGGGESALPVFQAWIGKDGGLDAAMARALGRTASPWAVGFLLRWLQTNPARPMAKEIRKSLFRLKSAGLPVPDLADPSPAVFCPPQPEPARAYVSAVDGEGARLVWIAIPRSSRDLLVVSAVLRDTLGIVDLKVYEASRRDFEKFLAETLREVPWDIVEEDPLYCAALIQEAEEAQIARGEAPNPEFAKVKELLGPLPSLPLTASIYRHLNPAEVRERPDLVERSSFLFEKPSFRHWFLKKTETARGLALLKEAAASRIILVPHQQETRFFDIYRQTVEELFDEKRRALFRRRLEETATILWKKGDESGAKISAAAAAEMGNRDKFMAPHPFLLELVKRSILAAKEEEERERKKEGGLIVPP